MVRFDGDPIKYCGFIRSFEVNVACKVKDEKTRLMYLSQYCEGKARECIERGCSVRLVYMIVLLPCIGVGMLAERWLRHDFHEL